MFQGVERYVNFIVKNKLTQSQFLFLYLIRRKKFELITKYKEEYPSDDGSMLGKNLMKDLVDRGFIKTPKDSNLAKDYEITDEFNHIFLKDRWESSQEVWKSYPGFTKINGADVPLTAMDQYQFSLNYAEAIDYSIEEHIEVLKDVQYGAQKGLIKTTIEKFVASKGWEKIREYRVKETNKEEINNF